MSTWISKLPSIAAGMEPRAALAVAKAAADVEAHAKAVVPVDTGALRASIQARHVSALEAEVVAQQQYAIFVELGTSRMGAQPYMTPAADTVRPSFLAAIARITS